MTRDIMADYIPVNERIAAFYAKHPEGSLQSELVELSDSRVVMRAYAYRTPDDARPGIGYSSMPIPGKTSFTRDSEVENCETSAWGRAIAALGFEVKRGIATAEEVRNKSDDHLEPRSPAEPGPAVTQKGDEQLEILGRLSKMGVVRKGGSSRYQLEPRETPDGVAVGFRLEIGDGKDIPQVLADGDLGHALVLATGGKPETLIGKEVKVKGRLYNVRIPGRRGFYRLVLTNIETPDWVLPAEGEPVEAPSVPLFDAAETEAIGAAIDNAKTPQEVEL